jgi:zinc and cadmium transporter
MTEIWFYTIASTLAISLISFSGVVFVAFKPKILKQIVFLLISFAVGALFGNAFFVLIPESYHLIENEKLVGLLLVAGIIFMFILEKFIHWRHNHFPKFNKNEAPLGYISLVTDSLHNFTDGILIAAAWMTSPEIGIATTIAVILHEVPQEISDFAVLLHAGFNRRKALWLNFMSACTAILGATLTLSLGYFTNIVSIYILPFAAGGFIYLAACDLIPELHREKSTKKNLIQLSSILVGLALIFMINNSKAHNHNVGTPAVTEQTECNKPHDHEH